MGKHVAPAAVVSVVPVGLGTVGPVALAPVAPAVVRAVRLGPEAATHRVRRPPSRLRRIEVRVGLTVRFFPRHVGRDRAAVGLRRGGSDRGRDGRGLELAGAGVGGRGAGNVVEFETALGVGRPVGWPGVAPELDHEDNHDQLGADGDDGDGEGGVGARVDRGELPVHRGFRGRDVGWVRTHTGDDA